MEHGPTGQWFACLPESHDPGAQQEVPKPGTSPGSAPASLLNRGAMPALQMLNIYRHDKKNRALITLAGEIDQVSAPLVSETLERCLREGIRTIDVDLTPVTFCDCSGLNAFLSASHHTIAAGGSLRLHHPPPTLVRILTLTGTGPLLLGLSAAPVESLRQERPDRGLPASRPSPVHGAIERPGVLVPAVAGGVL